MFDKTGKRCPISPIFAQVPIYLGVLLLVVCYVANPSYGQGCDCDEQGVSCSCAKNRTHSSVSRGSSHHHHTHHNCQAVGILDHLDAFSNRVEAKLDRVFGRLLPAKTKQCQCSRCQGYGEAPPPVDVPVEELGVEPEEPGIADPLPPEANQESSADNKVGKRGTAEQFRVPVPPPSIDMRRQFPTSTEGNPSKKNAPVIKPRLPNSRTNEPKGNIQIPEWLEDPFKDDEARSQGIQGAQPAVRWTKRPTAEKQSSKQQRPVIIGAPQLPEAFRFSDSENEDSGVVKAAALDPILD